MPLSPYIINLSSLISSRKKNTLQNLFRVTVVDFDDKSNLNCGLYFAELLKRNKLFEVTFFNEPFPKNFLNMQGRNFFDFIDRGNKILSVTQADIVIWGHEEDCKIRLNFQIDNQYVIPNNLSFSLMDSLFVPMSFFKNPNKFSESLLLLIYGIIVAAIEPVTNDQRKYKPYVLQEIIDLLAKDNSPKDISREFMPYIMNMLGKIYLSNLQGNISNNDLKIISNLFDTALKNKQFMRLPIYYGCIHNNLGLLYEIAFKTNFNNKFYFLKMAIYNYQMAQKQLNRNYPYDYGLIAYHLSLLLYEFWKHTADLQALRDAVSQLREAEKVYSLIQFPHSWSHIEGLLGSCLTSLGMQTKSNELMRLAIEAYKHKQQIFEQNKFPCEWAKIQEEIGNIFYLLGKQNYDSNFMFEAKNYLLSAQEIYMEFNLKSEYFNVERRLQKVRSYIG